MLSTSLRGRGAQLLETSTVEWLALGKCLVERERERERERDSRKHSLESLDKLSNVGRIFLLSHIQITANIFGPSWLGFRQGRWPLCSFSSAQHGIYHRHLHLVPSKVHSCSTWLIPKYKHQLGDSLTGRKFFSWTPSRMIEFWARSKCYVTVFNFLSDPLTTQNFLHWTKERRENRAWDLWRCHRMLCWLAIGAWDSVFFVLHHLKNMEVKSSSQFVRLLTDLGQLRSH